MAHDYMVVSAHCCYSYFCYDHEYLPRTFTTASCLCFLLLLLSSLAIWLETRLVEFSVSLPAIVEAIGAVTAGWIAGIDGMTTTGVTSPSP